jgi:hypothetical protein
VNVIWLIGKFVVLALLIWWFYATFKKVRIVSAGYRHLKTVPLFNTDLIDCYVHFRGQLKNPNILSSPLISQPCVFYRSIVTAHWTTKIKKPGKGTKSHKKNIYQKISEQSVIVSNNNGAEISLNLSEFYHGHSLMRLPDTQLKGNDCPALCKDKAEQKFKKYTQYEEYCEQGQYLDIYGQLVQKQGGQLEIKPTLLEDYPSVLLVTSSKISKSSAKNYLAKKMLGKYKKQLRNKKIQLILIGLIFIAINGYFWFV